MKVLIKLVPVVVGTLSVGAAGGGIYLGNVSKGLSVPSYPKIEQSVLWEHISLSREENEEQQNIKLTKTCQRKVLKDPKVILEGLKKESSNSNIQDQISSLGEEQLLAEIDKQQREDEENIEKTCGEWSKYVGDSENTEKEIFRGNKEEIRKLIEGYGLENKLGNPSGNTVVGWKVEEGNCVEKDLRDGNIEITCQRISKE